MESEIIKNIIWQLNLNSNDDLPLNKPLEFHMMTIIIRYLFEEDCKLYPQVFFRWCFEWIKRIKNARIQ